MRLACVALALAVPLSAFGQDTEGLPKPPPRMPADETPSHYACTLDRLLRGERCTYEFAPAPAAATEAVARENARAAAGAAHYCIEAATPPDEQRPDTTLRKLCEDGIAQVALDQCSLEGRFRLQDAHGSVSSQASECADSLGQVLARTRTMAAVSLGCCRCLSGSHCAVASAQCNREIVEIAPSNALQSCLDTSCKSACSIAQREDPLKPGAHPPLPPYPPYPPYWPYYYPPYWYPPYPHPRFYPPYPPYPRVPPPRRRTTPEPSSAIRRKT